MNVLRVLRWPGIVVLVGLLALLTELVLAGPGPTERGGLRALRQTPDIPVASIILRQGYADKRTAIRAQSAHGCDKDVDLTSTISGVFAVAAQDNAICTSADLDVYQRDTNTYVVQAGGVEAAWIHTDVTNPYSPVILASFGWPAPGDGGILKKCVNSQAVYPLSEQHGLKARERRYTAHEEGKHWE